METIYRVWKGDYKVIKEAAEIIKNGGLVAFPTETVYGLGANGLCEKASAKIYAAKGRPSDNPLILHICERKELDAFVTQIPETAERLAEAFWPGPLTMIFEKSPLVPYSTTGGLDTVAIRMPSHPVARALIKEAGVPIAAPSANLSGRPSPTAAEHVREDLEGKVDLILDGGRVPIGMESTIIDVTGKELVILRPGYITKDMLEEAVGTVTTDPAILDKLPDKSIRPKAPGMKYRHYAPKGNLIIYEGDLAAVIKKINLETDKRRIEGFRSGVLACDETKAFYHAADIVLSAGSRKLDKTIAHNLFDVLRKFDEENVTYIYSESFEEGPLGAAIMNRLLKAAGYHLEHVG